MCPKKLVAALAIAGLLVGCGGSGAPNDPQPQDPPTDPGVQQTDPTTDPGGGPTDPVDPQDPPTDPSDPPVDPQDPPTDPVDPPADNCTPAGTYSGAFNGSIDATIPLLGTEAIPVEGDATLTLTAAGGNALKVVGQIQVIDPTTGEPPAIAPTPFSFEGTVDCTTFTATLSGAVDALGQKIGFSGKISGTYNGSVISGSWNGDTQPGGFIGATGKGEWSAKQ